MLRVMLRFIGDDVEAIGITGWSRSHAAWCMKIGGDKFPHG